MSNLHRITTPVIISILSVGLGSVASAADKELVAFRLTETKTLHFDDSEKADDYYRTFKKLGCQTEKRSHDGHIDISYRCSKWRTIELNSHTRAHKWENWLKKLGFETRHEH